LRSLGGIARLVKLIRHVTRLGILIRYTARLLTRLPTHVSVPRVIYTAKVGKKISVLSDSSILPLLSPRVYYFTRFLRSYRPLLSLHLVPPRDKWCCSVRPSPPSFEKVLSTRTRRAPSATLHDPFIPVQKVRFISYLEFFIRTEFIRYQNH